MDKEALEKPTGGKRVEKKAGKPPRQKKPSRLSRQQKILLAVAIVLAVVLAVVVACQSLFVKPSLPGQDGEAEPLDYGEGISPRVDGDRKSDNWYTVLILGRDTGGGGNTDTMLLASYDVTNQKAAVMSIPRDTMVNVSWDVKKINSVYNSNGCGDKGVKAVYQEISQLVGFAPDYQVVLEWEAVGQIVDAIGGVYFDVPYDMHYKDPVQDLVIDQAKGYRLLSGDDAMQVIRWRKNTGSGGIGDSGRMEIQQNFLKAVIEQMMKPENVLKINKLSKVFQENVETDLSFQNILWFAQQAFTGGLSMDNVEFLTMPWKGTYAWSRYYKQNLDYVVPIADELLEIVNTKLSPYTELFSLSDLDIMSVNADGSLSSSSGHVEDSKAAVAPVRPTTPADTEETPTETLPEDDGLIFDPETGEPAAPDNGSGTTTTPETGTESGGSGSGSSGNSGNSGSSGSGGATTPPAESGGTATEPTVPETPAGEGTAPAEPAQPVTEPSEPGFSIIEPAPEG